MAAHQSVWIWILYSFLLIVITAAEEPVPVNVNSGPNPTLVQPSPAPGAPVPVAAAPPSVVGPTPNQQPVQVQSAPIQQPNNNAPIVESSPVPATGPGLSGPVSPVQNGLSGTTTEHKSPDGSIITVTKFNGQLPPNAFHQHFPQMFGSVGSFGNPFYGFGSPLYPTSYGPPPYRPIRSADPQDKRKKKDGKKQDEDTVEIDFSQMKPHPKIQEGRHRVSDKFHFPASVPEYFAIHKRPYVPVIDNEFSDLI